MLTRLPGRGPTKTRLAADVGEAAARELASAFLADSLALSQASGSPVTLAYAPAVAATVAAGHFLGTEGVGFEPQCGGDLGRRILGALGSAIAAGRVPVLIGSDTPDLPVASIERAFERLRDADLVLGPAGDGGFYLIGVKSMQPALFEGVRWSTETVFERVVGNALRLRLRTALTQPWDDVDDLDGLLALEGRLARHESTAPRTMEAIALLRACGQLSGAAP